MANEFIVRKGLINLGGETVAVTDIVSGYTVTSDDYYIRCSGSTGFDVTLPEITGGGKTYIIKNVTDTTVNVLPDASNTIDGESTYSLGLNDTLQLIAQDTEWNVIGSASVDISVSANTGLGITENNSLIIADFAILPLLKSFKISSGFFSSISIYLFLPNYLTHTNLEHSIVIYTISLFKISDLS